MRKTLLALPLLATTALATTALGTTAVAQLPGPDLDLRPAPVQAEPLGVDAPSIRGRFQEKEPAAATEEAGPKWTGSIALAALLTEGNTERRTANATADVVREHLPNRTTGKFTWDYAENKDDVTREYDLEQRRTFGLLKHDYFLAEKTYLFAEATAMNNYDQNISLRWTAMAGLGLEVLQRDKLTIGAEFGAGYYSEQSSVPANPDTEEFSGRVGLAIDWQISEVWHFLHDSRWFVSLDDKDDQFLNADTRLRAKIAETGLFGQIQWILDYDNTPSLDENGIRNERVDHRILLSLGWSF